MNQKLQPQLNTTKPMPFSINAPAKPVQAPPTVPDTKTAHTTPVTTDTGLLGHFQLLHTLVNTAQKAGDVLKVPEAHAMTVRDYQGNPVNTYHNNFTETPLPGGGTKKVENRQAETEQFYRDRLLYYRTPSGEARVPETPLKAQATGPEVQKLQDWLQLVNLLPQDLLNYEYGRMGEATRAAIADWKQGLPNKVAGPAGEWDKNAIDAWHGFEKHDNQEWSIDTGANERALMPGSLGMMGNPAMMSKQEDLYPKMGIPETAMKVIVGRTAGSTSPASSSEAIFEKIREKIKVNQELAKKLKTGEGINVPIAKETPVPPQTLDPKIKAQLTGGGIFETLTYAEIDDIFQAAKKALAQKKK